MRTDLWGTDVSCNDAALDPWNETLARLMRLDDDVETHLASAREADPSFAAAHALAALLAADEGDDEAAGSAVAASMAAPGGTDRERSFVHVVGERLRLGQWGCESAWASHVAEFPEDLVAMDQLSIFPMFAARPDRGEALHRIVDRSRGVVGDVPPIRDLRAWMAHEDGRCDESHALADGLLAETPRYVSAAHAKAHAFYESSDHAAGLEWADRWFEGFAVQERPAYARHLSWHAGLHEIALGREPDVLERVTRDMAGDDRRPSDGAMTVTFLQLLGAVPWGVDPTGQLGSIRDAAGTEPPMLFYGYSRPLGLAALGDAESLRGFAEVCRTSEVPGVAPLAPDLALGLAAWVEGDAQEAARYLDRVAPSFELFGGSMAQIDALHAVHVAVLVDAGRSDDALAHVDARDTGRGIGIERRLLRGCHRPAAPAPLA